MGRAAGRGLPAAPIGSVPMGLTAPMRGIGGPAPSMMQPTGQGRFSQSKVPNDARTDI